MSTTLVALPSELVMHKIIEHLDFDEVACLRATCKTTCKLFTKLDPRAMNSYLIGECKKSIHPVCINSLISGTRLTMISYLVHILKRVYFISSLCSVTFTCGDVTQHQTLLDIIRGARADLQCLGGPTCSTTIRYPHKHTRSVVHEPYHHTTFDPPRYSDIMLLSMTPRGVSHVGWDQYSEEIWPLGNYCATPVNYSDSNASQEKWLQDYRERFELNKQLQKIPLSAFTFGFDNCARPSWIRSSRKRSKSS